MEEFAYLLQQNKVVIMIVLSVMCLFLIIFIYRVMKKSKPIVYEDITVPANFWFYSLLVNMQLGIEKVSAHRLMECFYNFLYKRYHIKKEELALKTVFEYVKEREDRADIIELYGKIWNDINDLQGKSDLEIIEYIKSIKLLFNKEDVDSWVSAKKFVKGNTCNNC